MSITSAARHAAAVTALLCTLAAAPSVAQGNMAGHDMGETQEIPPPSQLPAPLHLTGIGNSHLTITANPEAQAWFDQGLNLLHDFWDYESARAFEQAVRADPNCAMCFWGLYQTANFRHSLGPGYSKPALDQAVLLAHHASKKERLYIEAAVAEQAGGSGTKSTAKTPKPSSKDSQTESPQTTLLRKIVKLDPADLQARIFLAESLMNGYDDQGKPNPGTQQGIDILEAALKSAPNDSALNHYWIHAMEPSSHPERAIPSARLLASLAPASGHMVHMPGHIFYRCGDYAPAEHWFAASTAVDEAYMRNQHVPVDDDWNYVHNLMYGIANLMEEGKLQQATTLSAKLANARGEFAETLYIGSPRDSMTRVNTQLPIALRTGDWKAVLALLASTPIPSDTKLENLLFLSGQLQHFATGMNALQNHDLASAQLASNALDAELWRTTQRLKDDADAKSKAGPQKDTASADPAAKSASTPAPTVVKAQVMPDAMAQPLIASLSIMSLELRASILAADHKLPASKALFTQAADLEKKLGYREPPTYIRPVGETEGLVLLSAGDADGAHTAYAAALAERPNSGFSLYGLATASEAAHNPALARTEYTKFLEAWKDSDPSTPELVHARSFLSGQSALASAPHP
jgi:tetratricopeptide (TPR) repeat protein